ncbi:MAG: protein O-mannosyl-transferase [Fimbriimonadaceae bacterium]|jgi:hypothetical protein|nr:protein O-mannosyl-transferase [Fimbriimonadaceae bacterium]
MGASPLDLQKRAAALPWKAVYFIVGLVAFALYIPSLGGAPVWDDPQLISGEGIGRGTIVGAITQPMMHGYFRPLANLLILAENSVFHGSSFYYHLVNVAIHVCTCLLLVGLLRTCFASRRISLVAGLAMAVHPVMPSALCWVSGVTNALASCLAAGFTWTLILSYVQPQRARFWALTSAAVFALCLFTKEQAVALILLVPLAERAFAGPGARPAKLWTRLAPFAVATILFLVAWKIYFPGYPPMDRTLVERIQMIGQSVCYFALVLLFPSEKWLQTYSLGSFSADAWTWTILGYVLLAAYGWGWLRVWRSAPTLAWFGAFLFLAVITVVNIAPPPSFELASYRAVLAILPLAAVIGILVGRAKHRWVQAAAVLVGCWWAILTSLAIPAWADEQSLYSSMVSADPSFLMGRRNLAYVLLRSPSGDPAANAREAAKQLEAALDQVYGSQAWREENLAVSLPESDRSVAHRLGLSKGPSDPYSWLAGLYGQLARARWQAGDTDGAHVAASVAARLQAKAAY